MLQYLVILGLVAQFSGDFAYIRGTLTGRLKPNRISWLMWAVAPLIAFVAALADGVRWAALPVFGAGFGPLFVFIVSFKNPKSFWKLGYFDYLCGIFSLLALILWAITKEPAVAIFFAIISDLFAAIPTLIKSWKYPKTESGWIFLTGIFSTLTILAAVKSWFFSQYAFALYICAIDTAFVLIINRQKILRLIKI
jgi:hypothetical protein